MAGQIRLAGAQLSLNLLGGGMTFAAQSSAPTYVPGLVWINTGSSNTPNFWNGTTWVAGGSRYLALLTADPNTSGAGGGAAVNVSDLVEVTTPGYARAQVTLGLASSVIPSVITNSGLVTWGPMTSDMTVAAQWVALVTNASGSSGVLLYTWSGISEQVTASQTIQVPASLLTLSQS
jgi:hypothetical protein